MHKNKKKKLKNDVFFLNQAVTYRLGPHYRLNNWPII
jgi:hypothetical protein